MPTPMIRQQQLTPSLSEHLDSVDMLTLPQLRPTVQRTAMVDSEIRLPPASEVKTEKQ